jgi:hypothetical protein
MEDIKSLEYCINKALECSPQTEDLRAFIERNKEKWKGQPRYYKFLCLFSCLTAAEMDPNIGDYAFGTLVELTIMTFCFHHCTITPSYEQSVMIFKEDDESNISAIESHNQQVNKRNIAHAFCFFARWDRLDPQSITKRYTELRDIRGPEYALQRLHFMIRTIDHFMKCTFPENLQRGIYYEFLMALRASLLLILSRDYSEGILCLALHKKSKDTPNCFISMLSKEMILAICKLV